jgi:hypothetical protein
LREEERIGDSSRKVQSWMMGEQGQERANEDWEVGRFRRNGHVLPWSWRDRHDGRWGR